MHTRATSVRSQWCPADSTVTGTSPKTRLHPTASVLTRIAMERDVLCQRPMITEIIAIWGEFIMMYLNNTNGMIANESIFIDVVPKDRTKWSIGIHL